MKIAQRFSAGWSVVQPQSPRSGRLNRPADFVNFSAVRFADLSQCLGSAPSAEALGYSQPSTSPTFEARPPATCHLPPDTVCTLDTWLPLVLSSYKQYPLFTHFADCKRFTRKPDDPGYHSSAVYASVHTSGYSVLTFLI